MEMEFSELHDVLQRVVEDLNSSKSPAQMSVRELIRLAGGDRRTLRVSFLISSALAKFSLGTDPDFNTVPLDSIIDFVERKSSGADVSAIGENVKQYIPNLAVVGRKEILSEFVSGAAIDPSFRISRLPAADTNLISVKPDMTLMQAITLMLRHDYSQLPVMTHEREVKGVISWESIGRTIALTSEVSGSVRDFMGVHKEISASESIFKAIPQIVEHSYVLVRADDRRVTGIITTVDLSLLFQQLSEPFLLLSEIENHVRKLIDGRFTKAELSAVVLSESKDVELVSDLTFGEYIRLLQSAENWGRLGLKIDRAIFIAELDKVRVVRNNVMHFDPDGISDEDHRLLHQFVRFMHHVQDFVADPIDKE